MTRKFIGVALSIVALTVVSFPAHATVWIINGGGLTNWFTQGVNGSGSQNIYENGFGTSADWTPAMPTRVNGYNCFIGGLTDLSCGDDAGEGAVPEIWGAAVVYSGTIDDVAITGTISWTGESGTAARTGFELFTSSVTSGSYDVASSVGVGGLTGTFNCWNNPAAVNTYGADFCGAFAHGTITTAPPSVTIADRALRNGMVGFVDNGDGTITVTLSDTTYSDCLTAGALNCVPDSSSANTYGTWTFNATAVPVPAALWLFGSALGLLGWMRRNRRGS